MTPYDVQAMPAPIADADLELLAQVETATVGHWRHIGFMDRRIQPLLKNRRIVGTAVTIAIPGPDSALLHHALGLVRRGDILVIDRLGDDRHACWGGGVTIAAKAAGAVAGIIDGPCTDEAEIAASDFPVWCRGLSPVTTRIYDLGGAMNVPVSCGGAVVLPGDAILADESGVLVLRAGEVRAVSEAAIARQNSGRERESQAKAGANLGDLSGATKKVLARLA